MNFDYLKIPMDKRVQMIMKKAKTMQDSESEGSLGSSTDSEANATGIEKLNENMN